MKIKLTKKWTPKITKNSPASRAIWNNVFLDCDCHPTGTCMFGSQGQDKGIEWENRWVGSAQILGLHYSYRFGPHRESIALARRDAERLAIELEQDLKEGARRLVQKYCEKEQT